MHNCAGDKHRDKLDGHQHQHHLKSPSHGADRGFKIQMQMQQPAVAAPEIFFWGS